MSLDIICWKCGKVAFRYLKDPAPGDLLEAKYAVHEDGSRPEDYSRVECQHCKSSLWVKADGTSRDPYEGHELVGPA